MNKTDFSYQILRAMSIKWEYYLAVVLRKFSFQKWTTLSGSGGISWTQQAPSMYIITKTCLVVFVSVKNVNNYSRQVRSAHCHKVPSREEKTLTGICARIKIVYGEGSMNPL